MNWVTFLVIFGVWCFGWGVTTVSTGVYSEPKFWRRTRLMGELFFIWPYIAWADQN